MKWFEELNVRTRLLGGFLIVAVIGGLVGLQGILKAGEINDLASKMYEEELVGLRYTAEANIQLLASSRAIRNALISYNDTDRAAHLQEMEKRLDNVRRQMADAAPSFYWAGRR